MWTRSVLLAMAVAVICWAGPSATDAKADEKDAAKGLTERLQDLNLTDEQEAKIAEIRKDYAPKVQDATKELAAVVKEEVEKIQGLLTPEQKTKLEAAKEERKERRMECLAAKIAHLGDFDLTEAEISKLQDIRKDNKPKIEAALKQFQGLLSDEQKKAREEALTAGQKRREVLQSLKLTDEQKEKVQTACKEVTGAVRDEMEKMCEVFTAEQKEKLEDLKDERKERIHDRMAHRIANLKDLNLTDEQKTQIADIRKEYRPKVHEAGNKLRTTIREEMQAIVAVIKG